MIVDSSILIDYLRGRQQAIQFLDPLKQVANLVTHAVATLNDRHFRPFPDLQVVRPY